MPAPVRLALVFAASIAILGIAYFVVSGFIGAVLILVALAVFWIGLKQYVVPKQRSQ
ncbi:MAG TPA: hypothetical protein VKB43_02545 [Gaiellaceae bacterium]|nr:hypothetical protein [Gaiellaceae bacterium]